MRLVSFIIAALAGATYAVLSEPASSNAAKVAPSETTFVMIPGAFHVDAHLDIVAAELQKAGYNTRILGLITVNQPKLTIKDDINYMLVTLLNPLIVQQGKDIVLYLHSYAGFPGSAAIQGLSKEARAAKGLSGGIVGLIYQSAFVPLPGDTLLKMIGGSYAPWQAPQPNGLIDVINPIPTFYNDVSDTLAAESARQIYPQSTLSFNTASGPVYYADTAYNGRRVYLHTALDQALPPAGQDAFVSGSGTKWDVITLNTGHSPWLSEPTSLSTLLQQILGQFASTY